MRKCICAYGVAMLSAVMIACGLAGCSASAPASKSDTSNMAMAVEETQTAAMDIAPGMQAANDAQDAPVSEVNTSSALIGRKLIRTMDLSVETSTFDGFVTGIQNSVVTFGGYIEQASISGSGTGNSTERPYGYMVVRLPYDKLDSFVSQVSQQSTITQRSENTRDVTLQYSDMESRKKSLTIEQERIWALLEKADTLESIITLEQRLSEIRYELESYESQLRSYDDQVAFSTVTINISQTGSLAQSNPDTVIARIQHGFSRNFSSVGNSLVNFLVWLISSLPLLVILGVIACIVWAIRRFFRKKRNESQASQETPDDSSKENN